MYKVETINVKGGLVNDAYARVPKLLEEKLIPYYSNYFYHFYIKLVIIYYQNIIFRTI